MTAFTKEWLRAEALAQGLALTDADVDAIYERLALVKAALAAQRPEQTETLEPPYRFVIPAD
jgi:hypothetical protein